MIQGLARFFGRNRHSRWMRRVDRGLVTLHKGYENVNHDIRTNGELRTIHKLAAAGAVKTVFDVGANRGDWSELASQSFAQAQVHAFEIVPETFRHLQQRFGGNGRVRINEIGLAEEEGTLDVYFSPDRDVLATCVAGFSESFHKYEPAKRAVPVTTGDLYCASHGVEKIDFLKVDVEGFEPQVLRGFGGMLERGKVDAIQFEYGYINIDTRFLLKDFYALLTQRNMTIGKIYPDYVDFRPYRHVDEDFYGPNYLAVNSSRQDLLRILGSR